jgi:6-phosphogluconolactonase (cycloisomerase 2 family)
MKLFLRTAVLATLAAAASLTAHAGTERTIPGRAVFVNANDPSGNKIVVLHRTPAGRLIRVATVPTGGKGSGVGEIHPPDPLGSQGALVLSDDGNWLFAANPGSNEISVFKVVDGFPLLTDVVSSGGVYPNSITARKDTLFVLNAGRAGNVTGFKLSETGQLRAIPDSTRVLATVTDQLNKQPNITNGPSQVKFSPDGNFLTITDKNSDHPPGDIQVFSVGEDGSLSASPVVTPSPDAAPFGIAFDKKGHMLVLDDVLGAVQSYDINDNGTLQDIATTFSKRCVGPACSEPCWIDFSKNFAFTSNTSSNDITSYRLNGDGSVTLLNASAGQIGDGSAPIDLSISGDGRWLHVLSGAQGFVRTFRINQVTGTLTFSDDVKLFAPLTGAAGIAAE